jgi:hypothetical protein
MMLAQNIDFRISRLAAMKFHSYYESLSLAMVAEVSSVPCWGARSLPRSGSLALDSHYQASHPPTKSVMNLPAKD